ncbi:MAG: glycosyltransferase family 39 protein [Candidatus Omnitrophica bacterium]|nr:glycosyltransferase family 39 protein [Candidatus Omnitrophota bacterium]
MKTIIQKIKEEKALWMILLFSVVVRMINITMPLLEGTATRQIRTAMVARNLFLQHFNIFYPSADFLGPGPGYLVLEFPFLNAIIAFFYKILGGVHEWAARAVVIAFFIGTCLFLYKIVKRLFNEKIALISLFVFTIFPLSVIYSRTVMPDFVTLFFSLGALFFMLKYAEAPEIKAAFYLSSLFLACSLLVKPQSFYMLISLVYLMYRKDNNKFILKPSSWVYIFIGIVPIGLWLLHGKSVHTTISAEEFYNFKPDNWFLLKLLWDLGYYKNTFMIINTWALSVFGFILFIAGLFVKINKDKIRFLLAWLSAVILYYIAFNTHIMYQPYYHVPLLPVAAIFIALSINKIWEHKVFLKKYSAIVLIIGLLCAASVLRYALYAYIVPKGYRHIPELARTIDKMFPDKDTLLVTTLPDGHATLYYAQRKGWSFTLPGNDPAKTEAAIKLLEKMKAEGAKCFVSVCDAFFDKSPDFKQYIVKNYKLADKQEGVYSIYLLK